MTKFGNIKFALLTLILGLILILLRISIVNFNLDEVYVNLLPPFFVIPFIYFFTVSFSKKQHRWQYALQLVLGLMLVKFLVYYGKYDELFIIRTIGSIASLLLISISYIDKIEKWLIR